MRAAPAHATFERGTLCTLQIPLQKDRFKSLTKNGYISVQLTREWVPRVSPEFLQIDSECRGSGHGEERGGGPDGPEPPPELGLRASIGRGRVSPSRDLKGTRSCQEVFLVMPKEGQASLKGTRSIPCNAKRKDKQAIRCNAERERAGADGPQGRARSGCPPPRT